MLEVAEPSSLDETGYVGLMRAAAHCRDVAQQASGECARNALRQAASDLERRAYDLASDRIMISAKPIPFLLASTGDQATCEPIDVDPRAKASDCVDATQ
jgi:hypothetical protein